MRIGKTWMAALVGLCLTAALPAAMAQETTKATPGAGTNLLLALNVGEAQKGVRNFRMVTRAGETARMLVGWRMPIPTVRSAEDGGDPQTSFVYQNVGMTARLLPELLPDGRVRVSGEIEISGSKESEIKDSAGMPVIGTFQQTLDVLLQIGKPLRIAEVPDPEGGQRYLEVVVTRID